MLPSALGIDTGVGVKEQCALIGYMKRGFATDSANQAIEVLLSVVPCTGEHGVGDDHVAESPQLVTEEPLHKVVRITEEVEVHSCGT